MCAHIILLLLTYWDRFPIKESGNKYIAIVADYFTKWLEAFAISDQEARTVAELLVKDVICRFGVPKFIHSDLWINIVNLQKMCQLLGEDKNHPVSSTVGWHSREVHSNSWNTTGNICRPQPKGLGSTQSLPCNGISLSWSQFNQLLSSQDDAG